MITKVLSGAAIALSVAAATASSAGADQSVYSALSCDCDASRAIAAPGTQVFWQQANDGIEQGLDALQGPPDPPDV
ncbi:hypothetical protein [Mycobacterium vicinigordonae]|uniref:Uncharacterized protein n=1 Tax=Mycobacterium vicinigordonae TaxID=1719132 RepID=A0A7D6HS00_9MYCO|nr:hypothetical protein [Mycobacterium vicinigordonae]QLL08511.1 hypothetical protein H0P51_06115 [Mycobacterium vicinigordonae]